MKAPLKVALLATLLVHVAILIAACSSDGIGVRFYDGGFSVTYTNAPVSN